MGEVKRIFNQAKIDRDTDARMVPPGVYRDALNVNVGESEGGDAGAVENLKGNEEILGQTNIEGTTIGSIRDPNNNKIYWFNKGDTTDAIYEYDESANEVNTILKDKVGREKIKPKCAPDFTALLDEAADDPNSRPSINITFTPPLGGCTDPTAYDYNPSAEWDNGTCTPVIYGCTDPTANNYVPTANTPTACTYDAEPIPGCTDPNANNYEPTATVDNGSCTYNPTVYIKTLVIQNDVSGFENGSLTGDLDGAQRTGSSGSWSFTTGVSANTGYSYSGNAPVTISGTFDSTSNVTSTITGSITQDSVPIYELNATSSGSVGSNISIGGESISGQEGTEGVSQSVSFVATASLSSGYEWVSAPSINVSGLPSGVSSSGVSGAASGGTGSASVTIGGTWTPSADVDISVVWSGGSAQVIPPTCNTYRVQYSGTNLQLNYTNCTTGTAAIFNLSNAASDIQMTSLTYPTQAPGGTGTIYSITQI